jgi:hypothetical protein
MACLGWHWAVIHLQDSRPWGTIRVCELSLKQEQQLTERLIEHKLAQLLVLRLLLSLH